MSNIETVQAFFAAWTARDMQRICAALAPDALYHNIPMQPLRGRAAIRQALTPMVQGADAIEWLVHDIAESATGAVLTERTDRFITRGNVISVRVMGIFELQDGLIQKWRDYFDLAEFQRQANPAKS